MKKILIPFIAFTFSLMGDPVFFTPKMIETHLQGYSDEEKVLIQKDLNVVREICFGDAPSQPEGRMPIYLATAGGPGARKSTILERFLAEKPLYSKSVYLDPDPRTLKFMVHTYYNLSLNNKVIGDSPDYSVVQKRAYEKWRGASNYIVLTLLEEALEKGLDITYGTTSTGGHVPLFFEKLKEKGYQVVLLLCGCSGELRKQAVNYRNEVVRFYQSTPEDAFSKGKFFTERMGTYFAQADLIYIYWSDDLFERERLAAIYNQGSLELIDAEAFEKFVGQYEKDRELLVLEGKEIAPFDRLILEKKR